MVEFEKENGCENDESARALTAQAKVYAARMRLQECLDQADALEAIREIAANLIGSEEVAVYKLDKQKAALWLYWSFGVDPNKYAVLDIFKEPMVEDALDGKILFKDQNGIKQLLATTDVVNALVPIRVEGEISGLVVIFRVLPQKSGLDAADHEICRVLSNCAGRAIEPYRD
ncbi:MAG TPA: hypothetical protein VGR50_02030 [Terriglobales bacterium]|nr:hypothetical protein [Terriglobales bacterium]